METNKARVKRYRHLIKKLSLFKRALLKEMFYVLYLVSLQSVHNKMDSLNLATIFGGMVEILSTTMNASDKSRLCCFFIDYYPQIFGDMDLLTARPIQNPTAKANLG